MHLHHHRSFPSKRYSKVTNNFPKKGSTDWATKISGSPANRPTFYFVRPRIHTRTSTSAQNARPCYHQEIILYTQHDVSNKFGFPNTPIQAHIHPRRQENNICVNDKWAVCKCVCVYICFRPSYFMFCNPVH